MTVETVRDISTHPEVLKRLAKYLAQQCFRNTMLEDLHAGITPSSQTGDYTDVLVRSPYGEIPWPRLSRVSDQEMKAPGQQFGGPDRGGANGPGDRASAGGADRGGAADRGGKRPSAGTSERGGGGGDRVGNRSVSQSGGWGSRGGGAFSGSSGSAFNARASSSRGASSMGGFRGGGGGRRR